MPYKLRLIFVSLILLSGLSALPQQSAYGQATVTIDELQNSCGTQDNGSFRITVTAGMGPFSVFVFSPSNGYILSVPLTLGVPETIGVPPPTIDTGLPPANNIVVSVFDTDPADNFSTTISIQSIPEITGITTTDVDNSDVTCVNPNGSITINSINGGSGSFDFSWTGPNGFTASTQNISNLGGGDYVVTITDRNANCSFTSANISLTDPAPNAFTISTPDLTPCANGSFTVDLSLADPGVEYTLYVDGSPTATTVTGPASSLVHAGLSAGPHTISVRATLGICAPVYSSNMLAFNMTTPPASAVLAGDADICEGEAGNIAVTITGGASPYTITLDNAIGTINNYTSGTPIPVSPLTTTTYNVVGNVTDANGCSVAGSGSAIVTVNPPPTVVISGGGSACVGTPTPDVTFTFTGTAPFDFTYNNGTTVVTVNDHGTPTYTISDPTPGTYSVTSLTDDNGCLATSFGTPALVVANPLPTASISGGATVCAGDDLPDLKLDFTGTAPFDFTYTDGTTPVSVSGHMTASYTIMDATAGIYSVTALTDANSCIATDLGGSVDVIVNPLPTAKIDGGGSVCAGSPLPSLTFTFTGTAPFDFTYTDGTTPVTVNGHGTPTYTITNATPGTYSITALTDNKGCAATSFGAPVPVVANPLPTASASGGGTVCFGETLPNVILTFTGTAPFDFTYTDGTGSVNVSGHGLPSYTITNAPAGSYSVTSLTDANSCAATNLGGSADVIVNPLPKAVLSGGGTVCSGSALPSVTFAFTETPPFDFTYSNGTNSVTINNHNFTSFTIPNAPAGNYTITALEDDKGCIATDFGTPVEVKEDPLPTASVIGGGTACIGDDLPDVTFTFSGTAPFDFTYTDGSISVTINDHNSTSYTIVDATTGIYSVTALTDAKGCAATNFGGSANVTVNPSPTVEIGGGGSVCIGSTLPDIIFTFTGSIPFDFTYTDGTNSVNIINNSTTYTIKNAAPGTYAITALADNNGCIATDLGTPVAVVQNALPTADVSGGGTLCAGNDLPDVTLTFTGTAPFNFTYSDGTASVSVSGHMSATYTITDAPAGIYSVTALTDANSCIATDLGGSADVIVNPLPTAKIDGGGSVCVGSPLPSLTFTFTGTAPFDFTYTDGTTPVTVSGHGTPTYTITNPTPATYSITALTDNKGCVATNFGTPVSVVANPLPTASASGGGTVCFGETLPDVTLTFTGSAPFDFTYTDGTASVNVSGHGLPSYTIINAPAGSYSVTSLTDANSCDATNLGGSADVIVNALPTAVLSGGGSVCSGSALPSVTFTFTGKSPFDFTYTDGTAPVTVTGHAALTYTIATAAVGTYSITSLKDANGCVATNVGAPVAVVTNPLPTAEVDGGGPVCAGGVLPDITFTFTGTAPFDFTYSNGSTSSTVTGHGSNTYTVTNAPAGTYSVSALADANACVATDLGTPVAVVVEPAPIAEAGNAEMICIGGSHLLAGASVSGTATSGAWSIFSEPAGGDGALSNITQTTTPETVDFTATVPGTYILRLTTDDPAGICDPDTDDVIITVTSGAVVDAGNPQTICVDGAANLTGTFSGTTGITWSTSGDGTFDDASLENAVYTPGSTDKANKTVTLTITSAGPCAPESDNVVITISPVPVVNAGASQTICSDKTHPLTGSFGGSATGLVWSTSGNGTFDDDTDEFATYTPGSDDITNGTVTLTATSTGGCSVVDANIIITINPAAIISAGSDQTVCIGTILTLDATLGGDAASMTWATLGDGTFNNVNDPKAVYTPGTNDLANGTVNLKATTDNPPGVCAAASDDVLITFKSIPGDQTTAGTDTWIGYVYDDTGDLAAIPARIDFSNSKYRGFIEAPDIDNMSAASTYDVATDVFDLNLDILQPVHGPNVCGNLENDFSIRYKMTKTLSAGIYRFTVGADDGIRLLIDGVNRIPETAFALQSYATYTTAPICLSGAHEFEIHYFDNDAFSRLTFDYEEVPALTATSPVEVCINSTAPVLTASSTDPDVVGFNWYENGALIFTGPNYTPAAAQLDMATAGTNTFQVTADYGCGEAEPVDVIVEVTNSASLVISPQTICESGGIVDLSTLVSVSPAGGTLSFIPPIGINLTGNDFDPVGHAGSTISILVDYSTASCTAPQGTLELTITNSATTTVPATAVAVCGSAGAIDLTTLVSASPPGGIFEFTSLQGNGSTFDPSGLSGLYTINVNYSIGGCVSPPATFEIDVTTTASITTTNASACPNGSSINLLTLVSPTPPGGTFSFTGSNVVGDIFTPGSSPGTIDINVDYDINGCTDDGIIQITVLAPTDPLCTGGNCTSVVIVPKTEPATCTNSDGRMVMSVVPFTPAVNNTGVKITIDGISSTNLPITRTIFNDSVFNQLPVGSYTYTIEYGDPSCIKTGIFSIDQSGTVGTPIASDPVSPLCFGSATGSVRLEVPGETGNVLEWSLDGGLTDPFKPFTAGSRITGLSAGPAPSFQHVISVRRNISDVCYSSVTIPMHETVTDITATFDITSATCNGNDGAITSIIPAGGHGAPYSFSIDGGVSYQSTSDFKGLVGGMYTLRVKDDSGCERNFPANITFPGFINFDFVKENADCAGNEGSILVSVPGSGPSFRVALGTDATLEPAEAEFKPLDLNAQFRFPNLQGGQYFVFVKSNASSCSTHSGPIDILDFKTIGFDLRPDCNNNQLSLALVNITGDSQGPQLQIKVSKKLSSQAPIIINEQFPSNREVYLDYDKHVFLQTPGAYQINIVQVQQLGGLEFCDLSSDIVDFTVPEPVSALPLVLKPEDAASYPDVASGKLMIGGFRGGLVPYDVRVVLETPFSSDPSMQSFETPFEEVGLNNDHKFEMFYRDLPPGEYGVTVMDSMGCSITFPGSIPMDEKLFIPNVFTPNGDDLNDVFFIRNLPRENSVNKLIISNRWGKQVFISDNYQNNWDGTGATDGIYFYRLQLSDGDTRTGWVEIMRGPKP